MEENTVSREIEDVFNRLNKYLDEHQDEVSGSDKEGLEWLIGQFASEYNSSLPPENVTRLPETAFDYMMAAHNTKSKKKKLEYVQKALKLEPDNLDAALMNAELTAKHPEELLMTLPALIEKGTEQMKAGGYFQEDMGDFWGVIETRPYMRLRRCYMDTLVWNNMMKKACAEGEELLKLCTNDNLGVRYALMHLYAYLEDEQAALALHKKYGGYEETQMLLPLAVLYFKLGDLDRSMSYLRRLYKVNPETKRFLVAAAADNLEEYADQADPNGYYPGSMSELLYEFMAYAYLFDPLDSFFDWSRRTLKK